MGLCVAAAQRLLSGKRTGFASNTTLLTRVLGAAEELMARAVTDDSKRVFPRGGDLSELRSMAEFERMCEGLPS